MKKLLSYMLCLLVLFTAVPLTAFADEDNDVVIGRLTVGTIQDDGSILFKPQGNARDNGVALERLLENNDRMTLVIPPKTIRIQSAIDLGNNKTIIATGATIIQQDFKPIIETRLTKANYNSMKNVTIDGGTWKIAGKRTPAHKTTTTLQFFHAQNITIKNATVYTDYFSHAIELVACKNIRVENCGLYAKGKLNPKDDEVLQIDVATFETSGRHAGTQGTKYVKGQVCKNITVKGCTVKGGRGICTNKTETEGKKYLSRHHRNIKILNNTIISKTYEALCLHNAAGVTVKNNTIISNGRKYKHGYGLYLLTCGHFGGLKNYSNTISNNTIKGTQKGMYIHSDNGINFGKITMKNNKIYSKAGKSTAFVYDKGDCPRLSQSKTKLGSW